MTGEFHQVAAENSGNAGARQTAAEVRWCDGRTKEVRNLNRLLPRCEGCNGVKTGYTTPAGRCLAASATRDGYSLVSVVLRSPDSWTESGRLLNWGFGQPVVGVVEVAPPGEETPRRFAAPIHEGRLYVPMSVSSTWHYLN